MHLQRLVLLFTLALSSTQVLSLDTKTYQEMRQHPKDSTAYALLEAHVSGIANGFLWANAHLEALKQPQIFCAPRNMNLNPENYMQAVDELLLQHRERYAGAGVPLGGAMLVALRMKLPCKTAPQ